MTAPEPEYAAGLCPECGSPGSQPLRTRPDTVECAAGCGTWVRPDADPAVTWALDFWQRRYRDAALAARAPAAVGGLFPEVVEVLAETTATQRINQRHNHEETDHG